VISGVYEIVNAVNSKRYIGASVNLTHRWQAHRWQLRRGQHDNPHLQASWDKHGEAAFVFSPLMFCPRAELRLWEQRYMDEFRPEYNLSLDATMPMLGRKHSARTKAKMSAALIGNTRATGRIFSAEHRERIGAAHRGRVHSAEVRANISAGIFAARTARTMGCLL